MTSLYVDRKNVELVADGEALVFYENGERCGTVPLNPLSRVFLRGDIKLTASLLGKLGEHDIGVIVLSGRKGLPSLMLGRPHNDASRRIAQYKLSLDSRFCLAFSKAIVTSKIAGHLAFVDDRKNESPMHRYPLTQCAQNLRKSLESIDRQDNIASLRGVEGAAAAQYFSALTEILPESLKFHGRNRRPPKDPVNACLSLTYTLLHSEAVLAIHGAGLDPFIGFYHALSFGRESLASDVMEALRPKADRFVLSLFRKEVIKPIDFSMTESGCLMKKVARGKFYTAYETQAEGFRRELAVAVSDIVEVVKQEVSDEQLVTGL